MIATTVRALLLTFVWAALQGSFAPGNLAFGLLLALGVIAFSRPLYDLSDPSEHLMIDGTVRPLRRMARVGILVVVFLRELILSSVRVASMILRPTLKARSAVLAYPLDVTTDREITALSNLITLTPGTMTLDVSNDNTTLYIHTLSVETERGEEVIDDIKRTLEFHVHRALGPRVE